MTGAGRAASEQVAERVNSAAALLSSKADVAQAIRELVERYGLSARQARRYVERAQQSGAISLPVAKVVLTVKVPGNLVERIRQHAVRSAQPLSSMVSLALEQFLERAGAEARPPEPGGRP